MGGNARWPVLSFEVAFWYLHFHRTRLQLAAKRFTILARASHQSRVLNESRQLLTCKKHLGVEGLSNGEVFLFTLHHNEGITFQRNGCMRRIEKD